MKRTAPVIRQAGYTLIELLLYVAIVSALLVSVVMFYGVALDARVKNQSIAEVDQQGVLVMDQIMQAIRNAESIGAPAAGTSSSALSLNMIAAPTPTAFNLTGTTFGYDADGGTTDADNSNIINAVKFTAPATGTIGTLYARVGATLGTSPNNRAEMAIYSGAANPTTLMASSESVTLNANAWNAFPIPATSVTSGTTYWLAYNTNGTTTAQNNLRYHIGAAAQSRYVSSAFGTWPASFTGTTDNYEFSMYALINPSGDNASVQIQEGPGAPVLLTNDKVRITSMTFKNLSRPSTPGNIQVSFTLSRINNSSRNEYDYQKTFTSSATLRRP